MALTDLLKGVRRAAAGLAVAVNTMYGCGGGEKPVSGGGECTIKYITSVGNCDGRTLYYPEGLCDEDIEALGYVRYFSYDDTLECCPDDDDDKDSCDKIFGRYQCAIMENPDLYVYSENGTICLRDNLALMSSEPYPCLQSLNEQWYVKCFGNNEP